MRSPPKRVLVVGCKGLLGTPVTALFAADLQVELAAMDLPEIDITDRESVRRQVEELRPELVVNCAAYTRVDDCETQEALATKVNGEGAGVLAEESARVGARLFHISTDYVFEGTGNHPYREDDPVGSPDKLSAYGRSKLAGERAVQSRCRESLIIRTAWLFGPDGPGFPPTILRLAREKPRLQVVNDQTGCPTYAPDLAGAIQRLAAIDLKGVVHVTNSATCTWYEFACEILRQAGIDTPIDPVTSAQFVRPARRPAWSVLDNSRYRQATGTAMRPWPEALAEYLGQLEK